MKDELLWLILPEVYNDFLHSWIERKDASMRLLKCITISDALKGHSHTSQKPSVDAKRRLKTA